MTKRNQEFSSQVWRTHQHTRNREITKITATTALCALQKAVSECPNEMTLVEKQSGHQIQRLRTDNGGEYVNNNFTSYCTT
jgi:hypothetical protein